MGIAGVRALQPLFTHPVGETQQILFQGVDILLTRLSFPAAVKAFTK